MKENILGSGKGGKLIRGGGGGGRKRKTEVGNLKAVHETGLLGGV
jgi:hypothetical protein